MADHLPSALGNPGPRHAAVLTVPPGPRRLTDDIRARRFHVATARRRPRTKRTPFALEKARRILVVKLDFVGDWIVTTPFLDALRQRAPHAEITAAVIDRAYELASVDPALDRVVTLPRANGRRVTVGAARPGDLGAFLDDYRRQRFDVALVPRWDIDFNGAAQFAHGSGAPRIIGFCERAAPLRAAANRGEDRFFTDLVCSADVLHEADRHVSLLSPGLRPAHPPVRVRAPFTPADAARADAFLAELGGSGPVLSVAPFVDDERRQLPIDTLVPILSRLRERFGARFVIIAAPVYRKQADVLVARLGGHALSTADRLTLREAAAAIAQSDMLVGMDSGPAHIASGVGTPVAVFCAHARGVPDGHPQSPARFAPYGPAERVLMLQPAKPLSPCREGCEQSKAHCITQLDRDQVGERLTEFARHAISNGRRRAERQSGFHIGHEPH